MDFQDYRVQQNYAPASFWSPGENTARPSDMYGGDSGESSLLTDFSSQPDTRVNTLANSNQSAGGRVIKVSEGDSIQKAIDEAKPGDTIDVGPGVYKEKIIFDNRSGINLKGNGAILDGGEMDTSSDCTMIDIVDSDNITVEGFEVRNLTTADGGTMVGIRVLDNQGGQAGDGSTGNDVKNIVIKNNKIHGIENNIQDESAQAHGIIVRGTDMKASITGVQIVQNEVYDCVLGFSEAVVFNGNVEKSAINYNNIHNVNNIAIDFIGYEEGNYSKNNRARDCDCIGNTIDSASTANNPAYSDKCAGGIYVDGGTNIRIKENKVSNCDIGVELASEHKGYLTDYCTVTGNTFDKCETGLSLGGAETSNGGARNNTITNNSFTNASNVAVRFQRNTMNNTISDNILSGQTEREGRIGKNKYVNNRFR